MWLPAKWLNQQHSVWQENRGSDEGSFTTAENHGRHRFLTKGRKLITGDNTTHDGHSQIVNKHLPLLLNMMDLDFWHLCIHYLKT